MTTAQLINRWFRGRRNPIWGTGFVLWTGTVVNSQGWLLPALVILHVLVVLPIALVSDQHMDRLRNHNENTVKFSLMTLGVGGVISQYTTQDGSRPWTRSLSHPLNLVEAIRSNERRQQRKILENLVDLVLGENTTLSQMSIDNIRDLCKPADLPSHTDDQAQRLKAILDSDLMMGRNHSEFELWIEILRRKITTRQKREVRKAIRARNFEILKSTFAELPSEADRLLRIHSEQKINEARARARETRDRAQQEREQLENERKEAERRKEIQERIERRQLPEHRIRERGLNIPRYPKDPHDFEQICRDWLDAWGDYNVEVTPAAGDGGLDVVSHNCVAQAKFYSGSKVGRPELQQLAGAALPTGKRAVFFAFNGYTNEAINYADQVSMCLFNFNVDKIHFDPVNSMAAWLVTALAQMHLPE